MMLGQRIKAERLRRNWTIRELSSKAGLSIPFLSDLENGKCGLSANSLWSLARVLGITMDALMQDATEQELADGAPNFPPALSACAEKNDMPFRVAGLLLRLHQTIMASRLPARRIAPEDWPWERFHQAIREFL